MRISEYRGVKYPFFALAPMANITTYPFARQAVHFRADLVWTPMVHTDTILNNWPEAKKILDFHEISHYIIQLVGSDPEKFAAAVRKIESELKPIGFDLNFACPDKNIVKSGCGGALMKDPKLMMKIIKAVKAVTKKPVSVKTRAGWDNGTDIFDLAPGFKKAGVALLTVHPRTVRQGFKGEADWKIVKRLKIENPSLAICGSGDIKNWGEAIEKQREVACEGVMIGRSALGRPWIFEEIRNGREHILDVREVKKLALKIAEEAAKIWGEKGIVESRVHFAHYIKGFEGAAELRVRLMQAKTIEEIKTILSE